MLALIERLAGSQLSTGAIVGISLAGAALLALLTVALITAIKRADKHQTIWGAAKPAGLAAHTTLVDARS